MHTSMLLLPTLPLLLASASATASVRFFSNHDARVAQSALQRATAIAGKRRGNWSVKQGPFRDPPPDECGEAAEFVPLERQQRFGGHDVPEIHVASGLLYRLRLPRFIAPLARAVAAIELDEARRLGRRFDRADRVVASWAR